jgi:DNA-binding NarL/FixJ family response regulator
MEEKRLHLSPRETEVVRLLSLGVPLKGIPLVLGISFGVARNYASSARQKLGASSNAHAVRLAIEHGLLEIREG